MRNFQLRMLWIATVFCLMAGHASGSPPTTAPRDAAARPMPSLDEQVQEIKSDVLAIAAELSNLEERLIFPSNTQLAIFVSLAEGEKLDLDSVQILIDGAPVASHIYSFKELEALQKGGVQRLYTGNVRTGEHRIDVSVSGKALGGLAFTEAESFSFTKAVDPKLVGLTLSRQASGKASIQLGDW